MQPARFLYLDLSVGYVVPDRHIVWRCGGTDRSDKLLFVTQTFFLIKDVKKEGDVEQKD